MHEPPDGGVAEHVCVLALGLRDLGVAVEVAGPAGAVIAARLRSAGVVHHPVAFERSYRYPWRDVLAAMRLRSLIVRGGYDVVHTHSSKAGAWGRLARLGTGTASVYSPHCFGFIGDVGRARRLAVRAVERLLARWTDVIICVSEDERVQGLAERISGPTRFRTVLQGSPACRSDVTDIAARPDMGKVRPVVGTITALRRQKRVDVFLKAIPQVWAIVPAVEFVVVGNGPCRESLVELAKSLGLWGDPRFAFIPFEPPSDSYLGAMSVFVLSSDWEGLPISVLEAMACAVPPIATDVGGVREVVDETVGRLVPPRDPFRLARAIVELVSDEPRRQGLAQAAMSRHAASLTVGRMVAETAVIYRDLRPAAGDEALPMDGAGAAP